MIVLLKGTSETVEHFGRPNEKAISTTGRASSTLSDAAQNRF
jgi:hypothetical protein